MKQSTVLRVELLPANYGDAIWIEYGPADRPHRVLVDGGFRSTYQLIARRLDPAASRQLELIVLTHVDEDHIKGAIPLLADQRLRPAAVGDVWFNGWRHLETRPVRSPLQGEFFSALLVDHGFAWNAARAWAGGPVVVPPDGPLPTVELEGGLTLTLLSPTPPQLDELRDMWQHEIEERGLVPGDADAMLAALAERPSLLPETVRSLDVDALAATAEEQDSAVPNGSSIALLAEHDGRSVLLAGDAHPAVVAGSLRRLLAERSVTRLELGALKVAHHGSAHNTTKELLALLDCREFLISSNGKRFGHPAPECIARLITHRDDTVTLRFNYRSAINSAWDDPELEERHGYRALYPADGGHRLEL